MAGHTLARGAASCAAILAVTTSTAFGEPVITEADKHRVGGATPSVTEFHIEAVRRGPPQPVLPKPPDPIRLDALPQPQSSPSALDLDAVARGFGSPPTPTSLAKGGPSLLVFVSLGMPEPTLRLLAAQAARAGARLLLRGFVEGSLAATVRRVQRLGTGTAASVQIDPVSFDRYAVATVPSFVLVHGDAPAGCAAPACANPGEFDKASGDVSLDHALRQFTRLSSASRQAAQPFLRRLESR